MLPWYGPVIIFCQQNECGDRIEKIEAGNYVEGYEKLCQGVPSDTMMGERPATTSKNSTNVGTEDVTGESDRFEHLSQTGEEFSAEFIRDRLGIKRVNVMPNVDHFQPRGLIPDFGNDKQSSSYYEDVRSPFDYERPNTDCVMRGSAFYDSPIIQNPIRIPFSHVRRTSGDGGHGHEEASPWEFVPDQLATPLSLTELSPSNKLKFLCSYGGRIFPRPSDNRLRYVGGETRIISIRRNISWVELVRKTSAICNQPHTIKYQLPGEDLDALISVCSSEDLLNMIEEYSELEKNGNSQRLRIFLVSLRESESPSSFEVRSEQQQDVDFQYVVAVNGIFEPSPQKSAKVGDQVFHQGGSSFDHSPGGQSRRDSPTYFQAMGGRDYSPSSHLRLTPHILTAPLEVRNDVPKTLHDNSYYYCGKDGDPSSANNFHELYSCSTEDVPVSSNRSLQLLIPSSTDEESSVRTKFDECPVIPLDNVERYSDESASWLVKSMEKDVPKYRIVHTLSNAHLQGYGDGYATFAEQGAGGIACDVNISAENVPLLAYSSPSQEWFMKSQDNKKEHSCDPEEVIVTNKARTSNGDQGGVVSSLIDTDIIVPSRDNREVSADWIAENNSRSYQVGLPVNSAIDRVSSYRISATSSAIEEAFWEINTAKVFGQRDNEIESNPTNTNETVCDERGDRGSVKPLIVEDVTEKVVEDIPTSTKVVPQVQLDPELSESNISSPKEFEGSVTPDTDYEDVKSDHQDDSEDPISDAAMAEIEAGIYGLQIIKNEDLEELRELGSGTFGTVYHGKWRGTDVAIKRIKKSCFAGQLSEQERIMKDFWREAKILSNLHHPNVVAFYGVVPDGPGRTLATVTEFMVNGSLRHNLLRNSRLLDRRRKVMIAMDAAFGMEYLHLKNIVHFELKCDNLLVNLKDPRRPVCKVGDFGLSRIKQNTLVSGGIRGTLPWMAPELLNGTNSRVSEKVDIYSFGIAMWEMLTGEEPYANMHCGAIISNYGLAHNHCIYSGEWRKVMEECWSAEPSCRPSFMEVTLRLQEMLKTLQPKQPSSSSENKPK